MQKILSTVRRAIDKYNLIQEGDNIAVGLSGGKDSLTLLKALKMYSKFSQYKFNIIAVTIDMFGNSNLKELQDFCKEIDVEYHIIQSDIYSTVFEKRKEKNPCSLCSKLRRGMLCTTANNLGCNKIALGHTADDVTHTFLLSLFYEGRLNSFASKSYLSRTNTTIIRPLILTEEKDIIRVSKSFPIKKNKCPADKNTKREEIKKLLLFLEKSIPNINTTIFQAIISPERYNLFDKFAKDIDN